MAKRKPTRVGTKEGMSTCPTIFIPRVNKKPKKRNVMVPRVNASRKKTSRWSSVQSLATRYRIAQKGKELSKVAYSLEEDGTTQSLLGDWLDCPLRCDYVLKGFQPLETKSSLVFGGLFHWLLELLANTIRQGTIQPSDGESFFEHHIKIWLSRTLRHTDVDPQTAEFIAAQAKAVFVPYCFYWAKEDFLKTRWIEVEGVFDTVWTGKLLGVPVRLRGKRDGVCRYAGKKLTVYRLFETKTKLQIPSRIDDALLIDFQNQIYLIALNNALEEIGLKKPIREVMYNIIRRPSQKLSKKGETLLDYTKRVQADVDERPEHYYKRSKLIYTATELKRFAEDLERKIGAFADWLGGGNPHSFHRNERHCMGKFTCSYLSACVTGTMSEYVQNGRLFTELYE